MWGKLKKLWAFINGNKTKIGAGIIILGKVLDKIGHPEFGEPIQAVGTAVAGGGLFHAAVKVTAGVPQSPASPATE